MSDDPEPRFKGLQAMGKYAELGIRIAEESLAEAKRHNREVEALLFRILGALNGPIRPKWAVSQ